MLGAIIGDIIGSTYERKPTKNKRFKLVTSKSHFTDDSILTIATALAIVGNPSNPRYGFFYKFLTKQYPNVGYGSSFLTWVFSGVGPYGSYGNGSAMRVSPIGLYYTNEREVLRQARLSASVTHNHKEGIKGAQAIALAVFYAKKGKSKDFIKERLEKRFKYNLSKKIKDFKPSYKFDVSCQGSVPEAIICFLESKSFTDSIRNAVALGGDSDTLAAMTGSIAEAFYGIPHGTIKKVLNKKFDFYLYEQIKFLFDFFHGN